MYEYEKDRLDNLIRECMAELDVIGVKYGHILEWKVNSRAKTRWGRCSRKPYGYIIEISNDLLSKDIISDHPAKSTIFHELAHSVDGCMNHGTNWLKVVDLINDCYGYNITRTSTSNEGDKKGVTLIKPKTEYKYCFKCSCCGQTIKRKRMSSFVQYYKQYGCGKCGKYGTFEPIEM